VERMIQAQSSLVEILKTKRKRLPKKKRPKRKRPKKRKRLKKRKQLRKKRPSKLVWSLTLAVLTTSHSMPRHGTV
jgi:hypothetical protein